MIQHEFDIRSVQHVFDMSQPGLVAFHQQVLVQGGKFVLQGSERDPCQFFAVAIVSGRNGCSDGEFTINV